MPTRNILKVKETWIRLIIYKMKWNTIANEEKDSDKKEYETEWCEDSDVFILGMLIKYITLTKLRSEFENSVVLSKFFQFHNSSWLRIDL